MENQAQQIQPSTPEQATNEENKLIEPVDQPGKPLNKILISIIGIIIVSLIAAATYYFYIQGYQGKRVTLGNGDKQSLSLRDKETQAKKEGAATQISILEKELEPIESESIDDDFAEIDLDLNSL